MADFPTAVPALPQLPNYTQDDILALFDRLLPNHYLAPLKDPGPGYEYLQAVAKMIERVSEAISHVGSGCYIGSSTGGSYATVLVELYRDSNFFGEVTLLGRPSAPQGTLVGTANGYYYQLMQDVTFPSSGPESLGPFVVEAQAVTRGWMWNQPGPFYTADGEFIDGPINRLVKPVFPTDVPYPNFDPTIKVRQWYRTAGVKFTRSVIGTEVILSPGSIVKSTTGVQYVTMDAATFEASADITNEVRARPVEPLVGIPGTINEVVSVVWGSAERAVDLMVEQWREWAPSTAAGGVAAMLDGIGYDKGLPRNFSGIRSVQLERADGVDTVIVMPGTELSTADGYHYQTTSVLTFADGITGPLPVSVEPLFLNEPANVLPLSEVLTVKWGSETTATLTVAAFPLPFVPSKETDDAYRARLTFLPKTLTPNAIKEAITNCIGSILAAYSKTWDIRETWDIRYQSAYDFPTSPATLSYANTAVPVDPYPSAVFVYDAVPLDQALSNRYLSGNPERGVMVVRLPDLGSANNAAVYPGLAASLEQIKPAGATVLYVFGDQ